MHTRHRKTQARRKADPFRTVFPTTMAERLVHEEKRQAGIQERKARRQAEQRAQEEASQVPTAPPFVILDLPPHSTLLGNNSGVAVPEEFHNPMVQLEGEYKQLVDDSREQNLPEGFWEASDNLGGKRKMVDSWCVQIAAILRQQKDGGGLEVAKRRGEGLRQLRDRGVDIQKSCDDILLQHVWNSFPDVQLLMRSWSSTLSESLKLLDFMDILADKEILFWMSSGQWAKSPHASVREALSRVRPISFS